MFSMTFISCSKSRFFKFYVKGGIEKNGRCAPNFSPSLRKSRAQLSLRPWLSPPESPSGPWLQHPAPSLPLCFLSEHLIVPGGQDVSLCLSSLEGKKLLKDRDLPGFALCCCVPSTPMVSAQSKHSD